MKLILFAHQTVGLEVFNYLVNTFPEDISIVITVDENEIYKAAKTKMIPVEVFDQNNLCENYGRHHFELGILAWWPFIIKEPVINLSQHGFVNFHPSYLPFNRGKHYNFWALVEQSPFGVSLHKVDKDIDTGAIVAQKRISYGWEDTGETLYYKAQKEIVELFCDTYPKLRVNSIVEIPQDVSQGSFHRASELNEASRINLNKEYTARNLINLLRARTFEGHPGCWFEDENGTEFEIKIQIKRKNNVN